MTTSHTVASFDGELAALFVDAALAQRHGKHAARERLLDAGPFLVRDVVFALHDFELR